MKHLLCAEPEYWALTPDERKGRCGPGRGFIEKIIPDNILGVAITAACKIHDFMFKFGEGHEGFKKANRVFHYNLYRLIDNSDAIWKYLCYPIATGYFLVVASPVGAIVYWKDKNKPEELEREEAE